MFKSGLIFVLFTSLLLSCNSAKPLAQFVIDGINYQSVHAYSAKGDGQTDDTKAIQTAFTNAENVYFPAGDYVIASAFRGRRHNPACLRITDTTAVRNIKFAKGARLFIPSELKHEFPSFVIIKIFADQKNLPPITIEGINIYGYPREYLENNGFVGIKAIEHQGNIIEKLTIENARLSNLTSAGIITYASNNVFRNIYTENLGRHGIGARNPYNLGIPHTLYLENFECHNNRAYSLDLSGSQIGDDPSTANPLDHWTATIKNVYSYDSRRGIKTAGHWDVQMENINIIRPEIYGFFINKDAPGRTISIDGLTIQESGNAAMSLSGNTHLVLSDVKIIGCTKGINQKNTSLEIDGLTIDGQGKTTQVCRLGSNCQIQNFTIKNTADDYIVWISRGDITLSDGEIIDNKCRYPVLVHKDAGAVVLDDLDFGGEATAEHVLSMQRRENLTLKAMPRSKVRKHQKE